MRKLIETTGGRRFLIALGAGVATTLLQWFGKLDAAGNTYQWVVNGVVLTYVAGNTIQKSMRKNETPPSE